MDLQSLGQNQVFRGADVAVTREHSRQRRLARLTLLLAAFCLWCWFRIIQGRPLISLPHLSPLIVQLPPTTPLPTIPDSALFIPLLGAGKSPHVLFRPSEIE